MNPLWFVAEIQPAGGTRIRCVALVPDMMAAWRFANCCAFFTSEPKITVCCICSKSAAEAPSKIVVVDLSVC
jgi:hypothetical protein